MATLIRTERTRWRHALWLAAFLSLPPAAHGMEQEIYVTTGPDGVETFSNLPRAIPRPAALVLPLPSAAAPAPTLVQPALPQRHAMAQPLAGKPAASVESAGPGKSFLLDD